MHSKLGGGFTDPAGTGVMFSCDLFSTSSLGNSVRMTNAEAARDKLSPTIGYFTVIENEQFGWTGGILILNAGGRPLEFRCTLPLHTNRSQEILYGATLRSHIIAETIAPTLRQACRTPIGLLCCQQVEAMKTTSLAAGNVGFADTIPALVVSMAEDDEGPITEESLPGHRTVTLLDSPLLVPSTCGEAAEELIGKLTDLPDAIEPFDRIDEAIREAQAQIAKAA